MASALVGRIVVASEEKVPCGFSYQATVLESWKGKPPSLVFFSSDRLQGQALGEKVAFVYQIGSGKIENQKLRDSKCRANFRYYLPDDFVTILSVLPRGTSDEKSVQFPQLSRVAGQVYVQECVIPGTPFNYSSKPVFVSLKKLRNEIATLLRMPAHSCVL